MPTKVRIKFILKEKGVNMKVDFLTVLIAVVSLIIIAIPGFVVVKTKLIDGKTSAAFSALVLYVCAPAQVFMGFQKQNYSKNS